MKEKEKKQPLETRIAQVALDYNSGPDSFTLFICGFPLPLPFIFRKIKTVFNV